MKSPSTQAGELLRRLQQSTLVERLLGRTLDESALAALEELKDPYAAPYLVALALECERESARRVAEVVRATMINVSPVQLLQLDEDYRGLWGVTGMDSMSWYSLKRTDVARLARIMNAGSGLLGAASLHHDGHVREAAVTHLDALSTGEELPYLLVRLNDWVTPVADRARAAVMRRVDVRLADAWVANLALVRWLTTTTRRLHDDVVTAAFAMLQAPDSRPALMAALMSLDPMIRRLGHRLARDPQRDDFVELVRLALDDDDSVVRFEAVRDARAATDIESVVPVIESALNDSFMPIRREAFLASIERRPAMAMTRATKALLDRNPAMRELARFIVKQHDATFSFADFYRGAVNRSSTDAPLATAIAGLGETGSVADVPLVLAHLSHQRARVRREAVRALSRLDAESHASVFIDVLSDVSPKETHTSRDVLRTRSELASYDTIAGAILGASHLHGRIDALTLVETLSKWPALQLLLACVQSPEPELAARAYELLRQWLATANRRFTTPTPVQLAEITRLLEQPFDRLTEDLRQQLRGFIDPWVGKNA